MELTDRDDGTTVTAPAGSVITVRLHEARTGGYQWTLDTGGGGPAGLVVLTSEEFRPGARPGGGSPTTNSCSRPAAGAAPG